MSVPLERDTPLGKLIAGPLQPGKLVWIGIRSARQAALVTPKTAVVVSRHGIEGDHYQTKSNGPRQVTLIALEDIAAIASFLGRAAVAPDLLRRNFVTSGINLLALKGRRFRIGEAEFEHSGDCAPCSRMETNLGPGGYNAVRGRGGITARAVESGLVHIGDDVARLD